MVGIPHRACVQKGGRGVVSSAPLFMGWILQVFFMIPGILGLTSITPIYGALLAADCFLPFLLPFVSIKTYIKDRWELPRQPENSISEDR